MPANVKIYDGTGDPEDHMGRFVGIGGEWPMPVWCRMFQQTLDGKARAWFDKLPPGSIDNWGSLQEKFLNRFGMLKACDKDPTEISNIARRDIWKTLPHFQREPPFFKTFQQPFISAIKSYSFRLFSSLPGVLTPVRVNH
ncbi:reverse transcriptase domain-containing protein [Tanacetum coccineum]|uniref:Reverse transcriptase domain-containing protein n=1 Tax=Tanacetum coccineum TaxID=301880 RepID=A0ABQ5AGH4_9ASTR